MRGRTSAALLCALMGAGVIATSGQVLSDIGNWGQHDWDYFYFQSFSVNRTLFEFHELPFWNPWYMGGVPAVGNFQSPFPSPWLALDPLVGPISAIKLKIVAHHLIGLAGMYWMARSFGLSQVAALFTSGTFFFSSWLALRIHSGHFTYLATAYLPWLVGIVHRARIQQTALKAFIPGALVALMVFQGGVYDLIFAGFLLGLLVLTWTVEDRSARLAKYSLMVAVWALGFSAVKLLPVVNYMAGNPRRTDPGGGGWQLLAERTATQQRDKDTPEALPQKLPVTPRPPVPTSDREISKWDLFKFVLSMFLRREQRSNEIYTPLQGYGWHEYGVYIGPLAFLLAILSVFVAFRKSWPWLLIASTCFLIAAGNFSSWAPWTLLHRLPVFSSMHAPSRFLIPCAFAASMAAGIALDALRTKFGGWRSPLLKGIVIVVVAASLVDSVLVSRNSLRGAFPHETPQIPPKLTELTTIRNSRIGMSVPMLANKCIARGYEPIDPKVSVEFVGSPRYQGEAYFETADPGGQGGHVQVAAWTPNTVTVLASCKSAGWIVLNRNWNRGWQSDGKSPAAPLDGLVACHVGPGDQEIKFTFVPNDFWLGLGISILSVTVAFAQLLPRLRSRRDDTGSLRAPWPK